ncbi:MAG: ferrous iron transport protein B [Candidatus Bathyarchaeota archaeon]|nr:ferrous iron transport protein B [Candidatus Bathyarchaeota archaeon]
MKSLKVLLIGQPNMGKSSLLNSIVGPKVTVSNYSGTTVEITKATKRVNNTKIEFVDTPGIYSISDRTEEEKVTEKAIFEEKADAVIVLVDATALERGLYVALQILEAKIPIVLALNFLEDGEKKGIIIDYEKLKGILNIPVVPINPITGKGIDQLVDTVIKLNGSNSFFAVEYDDHVETAIDKISSCVKDTSLPKRFVSLRALEGDEDFFKYLKNDNVIQEATKSLETHPKVAEDIAITRYGTAAFIAKKVTRIVPLEREKKFQEKLDRALLHKTSGPLLTGLFLLTIFGILLYLGSFTQGILTNLTDNLLSLLTTAESSIVNTIIVNGLTGVAMGVSIALPYVFLFYLLLGLLEDTGLLSRFIVNVEWFLKKLGLPGKAFIPLVLGIGCSAPACSATRVLSCKKEQFRAASLFAFVPCSSRIAIILGVVGFYGGMSLALAVLVTSFVAGLIWIFGIKKIVAVQSEPLLLELPPYRKPLVKNVFAKSWIRMKDCVYLVIPLLALGGIAYGILEMSGLTTVIVAPFSSVTAWLGLPAVTIIPLIFGFLQKDLTGAMLLSVSGNGGATLALSSLQIYTFGVATTIGIPCIIALGMLTKELGFKQAIALTAASIFYGLLVAGLMWRVVSFF